MTKIICPNCGFGVVNGMQTHTPDMCVKKLRQENTSLKIMITSYQNVIIPELREMMEQAERKQRLAKNMVDQYQKEIIPGFRERAEQAEDKVEKMRQVLLAYEKWEADLIMENKCWQPDGMAEYPVMTSNIYERMLEIQRMRNKALVEKDDGNQIKHCCAEQEEYEKEISDIRANIDTLRSALYVVRDEIDKYGNVADGAMILETVKQALSTTKEGE